METAVGKLAIVAAPAIATPKITATIPHLARTPSLMESAAAAVDVSLVLLLPLFLLLLQGSDDAVYQQRYSSEKYLQSDQDDLFVVAANLPAIYGLYQESRAGCPRGSFHPTYFYGVAAAAQVF